MAQVELLQCLADRPGLRVGEAAASLRLAPNTVSTLVAQMTTRGLIEGGADSEDRRFRRLSISPLGREQLVEWQRAHERMLDEALNRLEPVDRDLLRAALPALGRLVEELNRE
jgi:DNA-binding MarR family transcriptional regulator